MRLAICAIGLLSLVVVSCGTGEAIEVAAPRARSAPVPTATPTPSPAQLIVGKWQVVNGTESIQFFGQGAVLKVQQGLFGPDEVEGNYRFLDGNTVRIELVGLFASEANHYGVAFQGNRMRLTKSTGGTTEYLRVP